MAQGPAVSVRILVGDCVDLLSTLPDESVHCVVTSSPYWGLRDYGTAQWEGGDAECDHLISALASNKSGLHDGNGVKDTEKIRTTGIPYKAQCGKCGAIRHDSGIGLEPTFDDHLKTLVKASRMVKTPPGLRQR